MNKATIQLEPLTCPSCIAKIEGAVRSIDGVDKETIKVQFNSGKVKLEFDEGKTSVDAISDAIVKVGYDVLKATAKPA